MPDRVLTKQAIARDQTSVESTLDQLIAQNYIDTDKIVDIEITMFGANQFLIVAVYYGVYTVLAYVGLASDMGRLLEILRSLEAPVGLTSSNGRLITIQRAQSAPAGLTPSAARELGMARAASGSVGLTCSVDTQGWEGEVAALGAVAEVNVEVALAALAPTLGLVADESTQHSTP